MQVISLELQLGQFLFQFPGIHAQINQRPEEHVPTDAAKNVQIQGFHAATRLLIWLAA